MKFRIILSLFFAVIIAEKLNFCTENSKKLLNYRVIGGRSANVSALPFYTLLFSSNVNGYTEMCGGSILNERWILTAAHCLPEDLTKANARIGLSSINEFRQSVSIMKTVIHRGFSLDTASKDIALLKTRTPIALGNGVNAVCLTRDDSSITRPGTTGAVAGFGKSLEKISMGIQFNNGPSNVLKSTFLPIQDTKTCSLEWWKASGGKTRISTQNICAGSLGHGSAPGDSGGPLLVKDEFDNIVQVGITSFGANGLEGVLDQEHYPGVYTRVSSYIPWILKVIDDDANNSRSSDCPSQKSCGDCLATSGCGYCAGSGCFPSTSSCGSIWLKTPYNCPKNSTVSYDEAYVRNSVFPLIGATHATSENEILACASKMALDAQHVQRINVTCGLTISDPCVADLYVFPSKRLIAVVFHGSRTEEQFVHQAQQFLGKIQMKDLPMGGKVIEYYATGFDSLYNGGGLKATLQQLLNKNPGSKVLITGHSLGGALATIVATTIAAEGLVPSNSIQLISSGSPRVGDSSFGTMVERLLPYRFRVVNQNDLVPELPPLNRNDPTAPQHITFEVFYKSGMTSGSSFTLCQMNEDPTCRNSIPSSNLTVHPLYFAVPIDTWFKKGCTY